MSGEFTDICATADIEKGRPFAVTIKGTDIIVCHGQDGYYAIVNMCTHAAAPLNDGRVRRNTIICPLHGARFDLQTGHCIGGQYKPLRTFETRICDGRVAVAVPD